MRQVVQVLQVEAVRGQAQPGRVRALALPSWAVSADAARSPLSSWARATWKAARSSTPSIERAWASL